LRLVLIIRLEYGFEWREISAKIKALIFPRSHPQLSQYFNSKFYRSVHSMVLVTTLIPEDPQSFFEEEFSGKSLGRSLSQVAVTVGNNANYHADTKRDQGRCQGAVKGFYQEGNDL
jgi:hypothetical protein